MDTQAVHRPAEQAVSLRMKINAAHGPGRRRHQRRIVGTDQRKLLQVPEVNGSIMASAGQQKLVRMKLHVVNRSAGGAVLQFRDHFAGAEVPEANGSLLAGAGNPLAVRREFDGVDAGGMAAVRENAALV